MESNNDILSGNSNTVPESHSNEPNQLSLKSPQHCYDELSLKQVEAMKLEQEMKYYITK